MLGWAGLGMAGRGKLSLEGQASSGGAESVPHQHPLVMLEHPGCSWMHPGIECGIIEVGKDLQDRQVQLSTQYHHH